MQALLVMCFYLFWLFLRWRLYARKTQRKLHEAKLFDRIPLAPFVQPHCFCWLIIICCFLVLLVEVGVLFYRYPMLSPEHYTLPDFEEAAKAKHLSADQRTQLKSLGHDLQITPVLRGFAIASPVTIVITFFVTLTQLQSFFPKERGFDEDLRFYPSFSADLAMQVVALPLIYGIFALDAFKQILSLMTGEAFGNDKDAPKYLITTNHTEKAYSVDFEFADLYEAWALYNFGRLCFIRVERRMEMELPAVQYVIKRVKQLLDRRGDDGSADPPMASVASSRRTLQINSQGSRDAQVLSKLSILHDPQKMLFTPLKETSLMGVAAFVCTYAAKSVYQLAVFILEDEPFRLDLSKWSDFPYIDGAALLASTMAIYNIIIFERKLGEFLHTNNFKPMEKFLGVKVLVSIAFLQSYGLQLLMGSLAGYSKLQVDLCFTCLICFEVLPLSILILYAWRPSRRMDDWYGEDRDFVYDSDGTATGHLAREVQRPQDEREKERLHAMEKAITASVDEGGRYGHTENLVWQEAPATLELTGRVSDQKGQAIENLVNSLSKDMTAVYRPAVLHRLLDRPGAGGATPGGSGATRPTTSQLASVAPINTSLADRSSSMSLLPGAS